MLGTLSRPLEVLRISTVVDRIQCIQVEKPLEVLRISTVVDPDDISVNIANLWKY